MTMTQPLKWHGGKHYLASWIISHFPPHLHYVEPFFGGGAVLLARDHKRDWFIDNEWKLKNGEKVPSHLRGCSEVVNDINFHLTNFWNVLKRETGWYQEFCRQIAATPFSQWEYRAAEIMLKGGDGPGPVAAAAFFVRARQSMAGRMDCFTPLTRNRTRGGGNAEANAWLNCIEGLPEVHERLKGVVILNDDACKVIRQQDGEKTLFYCDPPYLAETRETTGEYEHEMAIEDHHALVATLSEIKGRFILSGYNSVLYNRFMADCGWRREEKQIDNKASSKKTKDKKTECLWMNF